MSNLKMYICVREEVPAFMVPTLVAHTVLNADEHFLLSKIYWDWKLDSFKKCVVKVNEKEWMKIIQIEHTFLGHENTTLGGAPSCAIPPIMVEYPNVIKFAKLWKP